MKRYWLGLTVAACALASAAGAQDLGSELASLPTLDKLPACDPADDVQAKDLATLKSALEAFHAGGGFAGLKSRLPDLEAALSHAPRTPHMAELCGDEVV